MMHAARSAYAVTLAVLAAACGSTATPGASPTPGVDSGQIVTLPVVPLACAPSPNMPVEGRQSPYDSVIVSVNGQALQICYGRPFARSRTVFGGVVPFDTLWRTGANEPTIIHLPFTAEIAGLRVPAGSYSIYTIPREGDWTLIINRSTSQWGHPDSYTAEVAGQELGRATITSEQMNQHVEQFTIRSEPSSAGTDLLLEWERTRVRIPVRAIPS